MIMARYTNDFTYYWFADGGELLSGPLSQVPEEEDFVTIVDAVNYVQTLGAIGKSQHQIEAGYHRLALTVLKLAVQKYGEHFEVLLRGDRNPRAIADYKILFGTENESVANFYGPIQKHHNVRGLRTRSQLLSVITNDCQQQDEEIIFFPAG